MSASVVDADLPSVSAVTLPSAIDRELRTFLSSHVKLLLSISPDLAMMTQAATDAVLAGGKRLRPTFAYWGWRAVRSSGSEGEADLIRAASSLELLHSCALVHDDVMDASSTRRGRPSAHVRFASTHLGAKWPGSAGAFGASGAILLGDLLLSWAAEMFSGAIAILPAVRAQAAELQFNMMRTEVVAGQFLDVLAQTRGGFDTAEAERVIEFKTSKYTVQRPLLLGAVAAGAGVDTMGALRDYGLRLGEAFQLRDDLLGVFGDPAVTGKPAGDDLREGKRTLLMALAMKNASSSQAELITSSIGRPELDEATIAELRGVLVSTGAVAAVEARIDAGATAAVRALSQGGMQLSARTALVELATAAAHRTS